MDGSEHSDYAFEWFWQNMHKENDKIILLHVPNYGALVHSSKVMKDSAVITESIAQEGTKIKILLERLGQKLKDKKIGGKVMSVGGNPGEIIVSIAQEENATMIVTGTRGLGKLRRTILGSVSDYIVHHSLVPVLVCKQE